ncbi:GntR family transcriptional regulator [Paenalcaligenes sp. Me131]|uniref:GntR family transcriptional regulator n=1 Tax=Paenalcaligenes sp. Me131 TaxID=3392636 RepID=UPI003D275B34
MITNISTRTNSLLSDQAFDALRDTLLSGEIRSGQMVSISELCDKLGFATAPVRDAIKKAAAVGLVTVYPQRGIVVLELSPQELYANFHFRYLVDAEGARLTARQPDHRTLAALKNAHLDLIEKLQNTTLTRQLQVEAMELDWRLHHYLANTLKNPIIAKNYSENCDRIQVLQKYRPPLSTRIQLAMTEHIAILDAIASGDETASATMVQHHFTQTLAWWGVMQEDL